MWVYVLHPTSCSDVHTMRPHLPSHAAAVCTPCLPAAAPMRPQPGGNSEDGGYGIPDDLDSDDSDYGLPGAMAATALAKKAKNRPDSQVMHWWK